jgi:HAD superfamily hydrolase (TIGR01549 family)
MRGCALISKNYFTLVVANYPKAKSVQVDAVLFDLFNTLLLISDEETWYERCLRNMHTFLRRNGVEVSYDEFHRAYFDVRDFFYSESRESLEEPHFNVRVVQTLERLHYSFNVSDVVISGATSAFADEFMNSVCVEKDTAHVLQELRKKYKIGLISNFGIPECAHELLETFGLKGIFDVIVISAEINQRKPSPKIFKYALQKLGVLASRAVFVGDMLDLDVKGAQTVGMKTLLIRREPGERVESVTPDMVIDNLADLLRIL